MHHYRVFGGVFASELAFPELSEIDAGAPDWSLERRAGSPTPGAPSAGWRRCGSSPVEDGVDCVLHCNEAGALRVRYDDTGVFEISPSGGRITWFAPEGADEARARKDVLGRVIALAFQQAGVLTLHGSAVDLGGRAVCFIAPKFHGKSTTAAALVDAGGTLLADDLVVVDDPGGTPRLRPTLDTVHLWPDAARHVGRGASPVDDGADQAKVQVAYRGGDALQGAPLDGIYLLVPTEGPDAAVRRRRLDDTTGAMVLLGQLKVGDLLGAPAVLDLLPEATGLARRVGVHRLEVPRDLSRLPALVDQLGRWHAGPESGRS
ncbi:hypothetical protein [Gaopeijia maritima]|uniref:Serine kinase n=1 Tax=Gaopeijia maritima TaxID=3119007 RepID=A0ABU9E7J1_9BACT